jgi:predicted transcriptional regulator of viral defense system
MTRPLIPKLHSLASDQQGIVTRAQAISAGLSPSAIRRRVDSGDWQLLDRSIYATFTGKSNREAKLWKTLLRAGPGALLSHETAAEVHGFAEQPSPRIHISIPETRNSDRQRKRPGVVIHRRRALVPDLQPSWQLPRTTVEDTVLDLIDAAKTFDDAYGWICRALGKQRTATVLLRKALTHRSRIRWRAWITEALDDADEGINSPLERRYVYGVERAHGLPKAKRQAQRRLGSGNSYVDNLYEPYGVCVELDGAAAHPAEGRWKDTHRDNANLAQGANTLRYGWPDTTEGRCQSAIQVGVVLRNNGWTGRIRRCGPGCPAEEA